MRPGGHPSSLAPQASLSILLEAGRHHVNEFDQGVWSMPLALACERPETFRGLTILPSLSQRTLNFSLVGRLGWVCWGEVSEVPDGLGAEYPQCPGNCGSFAPQRQLQLAYLSL